MESVLKLNLTRKLPQNRHNTEIPRLGSFEPDDDRSPVNKERGVWTKMQNNTRLKLLAAGFLKSAFPTENLKKSEQIKIPHIKYRNSVCYPEGTQILLGLCQSYDFNDPFHRERAERFRQSLSPTFIEMICKTNIRRCKSKLSKVWSEGEEEKEFETERNKVIRCITGEKTPDSDVKSIDTSETSDSDEETLHTERTKRVKINCKRAKRVNSPTLLTPLSPIPITASPSLQQLPKINHSPRNIVIKPQTARNEINSNRKLQQKKLKKRPLKLKKIRKYRSPYENVLVPVTSPKR
ncbi:unnamed protein product [Blepharisma stoltei]|uniref:Uncharacterized protein n=1 Tax=Blepharisma stoltei TaxID=1481888 RepID=A0AAU9JA83_9CILI|nr:unnamed protein product [Blepharisma stoltei]